MKLLLLLLLATQVANTVPPPPAGYGGKIVYDETSNKLVLQKVPSKPREIIVTKIEIGPTFVDDPYRDETYPRQSSHAPTYKRGYFVLAKTTAVPIVNYKLACPWAPVEVGGTYFITQSSNPGEVRRAVFTDKDGKPSDMICFIDLE